MTPLERFVALFERLEDTPDLFRLDADAGVAHRDAQLAGRRVRGGHGDFPILRREFDCILEQIPNDLLEFRRVRRHPGIAR
jgi:hypothetical protein